MEKELQLVELKDWGLPNIKKPLIISGPCSAETEKQVLETALQLKKIGVNIYRAGIWKPRTKPGSFERLPVLIIPSPPICCFVRFQIYSLKTL